MDEKVNYYYDRFRYHFNVNNTARFFNFDDASEKIKKEIREIINNNYEHLLSESFISFLTLECSDFYDDLKCLYSQDYDKRFNLIYYYIEKIDTEYNRNRNNKSNYKEFIKYLNEEEKAVTLRAFAAIDTIFKRNYNEDDEWLVRCAIISLLADCFINNELSRFNDLCDIVLSDPGFIIDDLEMNEIPDGEENAVCYRIISIIDSKYNNRLR